MLCHCPSNERLRALIPYVCLIAFSLGTSQAYAQDASTPPVELPEVVVGATRLPTLSCPRFSPVAPAFNRPSLMDLTRTFSKDHHDRATQFICAIYLYAPFLYAPFMNRANNTYCFFMAIGDIRDKTSDRSDRVPRRYPIASRDVAMGCWRLK